VRVAQSIAELLWEQLQLVLNQSQVREQERGERKKQIANEDQTQRHG
jgi:hypothetical protein